MTYCKAISKKNGEWMYGNYFYDGNKWFIRANGITEGHEIIEDTICQMTNIKDKYGRILYINDIVSLKAPQMVMCYDFKTEKVTYEYDDNNFVNNFLYVLYSDIITTVRDIDLFYYNNYLNYIDRISEVEYAGNYYDTFGY